MRLTVYPPWPKESCCTGQTTSSCWFYCRAMKWQSSLKWVGSTVRPRHWARRCCWHPSNCFTQGVWVSSTKSFWSPDYWSLPFAFPCRGEELSKTAHGVISTHCPFSRGNWILLLKIMGEGGCQSHRWGGNEKKAERSWTAWSSSALPFTFFLWPISTLPCPACHKPRLGDGVEEENV